MTSRTLPQPVTDLHAARAPDLDYDRFHFLGNTSVRGAYMALVSREWRSRIVDVGGMMTYLELSADNAFFDEFNAALFLPHTDESLFPSVAPQGKKKSGGKGKRGKK